MVEITKVNPITFELQTYEPQDENLIASSSIDTQFVSLESSIEFFIYDLNNNIISENYNYVRYNIQEDGQAASQQIPKISQFNISPGDDVTTLGFDNGGYVAYYNFLDNEIGNSNSTLFISEISSDRTEIRLDSTEDINIVSESNKFIDFRNTQDYFVDFYLNFGSNNLVIANNIKLANETTDDPTIIIKLYEPLPVQFDLRSTLWVVTTLNEPEAFLVNYPPETIEFTDFTQIQGPNFNIPIKGQVNNSSQPLSYTDITSGASDGSQNQINSLLSQSAINISVDYTDFTNFINFSSAQTRIENFYYKVGLIESYTSSSNTFTNITSSETTKLIEDKKISNVINNFDKFEYFMYYSSGSNISYPKLNSIEPYVLYPTTSSQVLTWLGSVNEGNSNYGGQLLSASNYDNSNSDQLLKSIPEYLREDSANKPYDLFVDMVAQYYDNVWLYTKDITQKYNADNRLDFGVSKDLVSNAIKDFGLKLYQNNFSNQELYTAFLGITPSGSLFPFPEISQTLPVPTGMEFVNTLISASNDVISMDDTNKSLYKRIYHNIPYLLKSKGTLAGLRALITSYGIPDTILRITEFGGKDQVNANDYDLYQNNFNYAYNSPKDDRYLINTDWHLSLDWGGVNNEGNVDRVPNTVQFRFKVGDTPPTSSTFPQNASTVWLVPQGRGGDPLSDFEGSVLTLEYEGTGLTTGSDHYSGSIQDPNYQYAKLKFYSDDLQINTASISLPFYNGDWWSVMLTWDGANNYYLYSGNKIYNGNDGTSIGYYATSSTSTPQQYTGWNTGERGSRFAQSSIINSQAIPAISGAYQEIRYYTTQISESVFKDYIMNPLSFEGNGINKAPDQLAFRAALGSELDITTTSSIHPRVTGSWEIFPSFKGIKDHFAQSNFNITDGTVTASYSPNTETFFLDQPAAGIKNRITDKIRSEKDYLPTGNTLSSIRKLNQITEASASYTDNINYLEVAFSPQNQINDDIIGQMGHFNIGDYIGDPVQRFTGDNYPDLNDLSEEYFEKYIKQYDLTDFVRLIKFFDNSLFKMIKDFIPARTGLASGIVIKQHLLERNKYPQPRVSQEDLLLTGSIPIATISGGAAGSFNIFNSTKTSPLGSLGQGPNNRFNITQSWVVNDHTISGSFKYIHDSQAEFYNGEFSGSNIIVTDGELNPGCDEFKNPNYINVDYKVRLYNSNIWTQSYFIDPLNDPTPGHISMYYSGSLPPVPPPPPTPQFRPTVITNAITSITNNSMDLNGDCTDIGTAQVTEMGFYFGTIASTPGQANPNTKYLVDNPGLRTFASSSLGLSTNTVYYSTAFATNAIGEATGSTVSATTADIVRNIPTYIRMLKDPYPWYSNGNAAVVDSAYYLMANMPQSQIGKPIRSQVAIPVPTGSTTGTGPVAQPGWDFDEGSSPINPVGNPVPLFGMESTQVYYPNYYFMVFFNQLDEPINQFTFESISVISDAGNDWSTVFSASIHNTGLSLPFPAKMLRLEWDNDNYASNPNVPWYWEDTDNYTLNFNLGISSSNTIGTSTAAIGGASFNFQPQSQGIWDTQFAINGTTVNNKSMANKVPNLTGYASFNAVAKAAAASTSQFTSNDSFTSWTQGNPFPAPYPIWESRPNISSYISSSTVPITSNGSAFSAVRFQTFEISGFRESGIEKPWVIKKNTSTTLWENVTQVNNPNGVQYQNLWTIGTEPTVGTGAFRITWLGNGSSASSEYTDYYIIFNARDSGGYANNLTYGTPSSLGRRYYAIKFTQIT